ncbi:MAG: NAD-dependent epimerase/dehydratase family protein [Clostridia bacterium]
MILVTGGCGFIASHITDALIKQGQKVVVFDDLSSGSLKNLNPKAYFFKGDITKITDIERVFAEYEIDKVCHHAAQISVTVSMRNPQYDVNTNIIGIINLLQCAVKHGVKRMTFASSAAIYGNPVYLPIDEKHPKDPLSFYGLSKITSEQCIKIFAQDSDMTYGILRYANVYGPRQKAEGEGGVVAVFMNRMVSGQDCCINGDGKQTRDFIYVKDIAGANVKALECSESFIANVSTDVYTDINDLFALVKKHTGYKKDAIYNERRKGDIKDSYLTNTTINSILSWKPEYSLEKGLEETAHYFLNE